MKNKKTMLAVLLGCVLAVSAVAGGIAWNNNLRAQEGEDETTIGLEEFADHFLWNTPAEEDTNPDSVESEDTTDTKEDPVDVTVSPAEDESPDENEAANAGGDSVSPEAEAEAGGEAGEDGNGAEGEKDVTGNVPVGMEQAMSLNFGPNSVLNWPVEGEVIQEFSMDSTVYFPTLKQYKVSPAILVSSEAGTCVYAAADGLVTAVGTHDEIGRFVMVDLGGGYVATYGQLADVTVTPNQYVTAGTALGVVASPTMYYVVEGDNLYFELTKDGNPVDPLDYLR